MPARMLLFPQERERGSDEVFGRLVSSLKIVKNTTKRPDNDVVKDGVLRRFFVVVSFSFWHCLGVVVRCSVIPCDSLLFGLQCRLGGEGVCRGRVYFGFAVCPACVNCSFFYV